MQVRVRVRYPTAPGQAADLFKFMALPPAGHEEEKFVRDILVDHNLFFQTPPLFNDPYDCMPSIYANVDRDRWERSSRRQIAREHPRFSPAEIDAVIEKLMSGYDPDIVRSVEFQAGARDAYRDLVASFGVLCLSRRSDSTLMWSHYAGKHAGFVICFDGSLAPFNEALPVIYAIERPLIDPGVGGERTMARALLYKSSDWRYEQESRVVRVERPGLHPYPPEALKGIIFGMKMPKFDQQRIREMCAAGRTRPTFWRAVDDGSSYSMAIEPATER